MRDLAASSSVKFKKMGAEAIASAKRALLSGSVNEIIIAGERVNVTDTSPDSVKSHSDIAPISYYLDDATPGKIQTMEEIFSGSIEFSEENPVPPCKSEDRILLINALNKRLRLLSDELEIRRTKNSIVTRALVQHHRKLETMISALKDSSECNQYDGVVSDFIRVEHDKAIEKLVLQFAFLVLQGTDPVDLDGHPGIKAKAGNAKELVKILSVNPITDTEIEIYKGLRKNVIPDIILKILNKDGSGIDSLQPMIDAAAAEKLAQLVLVIIDIINENEALNDVFAIDRARILSNSDPGTQITEIVRWLVAKYLKIQAEAAGCAERVNRLGEEVGRLQASMDTLKHDADRLKRERDAAVHKVTLITTELATTKAENDALKAAAETTRLALEENATEISRLKALIERHADELAAARAVAAKAGDSARTLHNVEAQLAALKAENAVIGPLKAKLAAAEARVAELEAEAGAAPGPDRSAELAGELAAARAEAASARTAAEDAARGESAAKDRAAAAEADSRNAKDELSKLRGELAERDRARTEMDARLAAAAADVAKLKGQLQAAQAAHGSALAGISADAQNKGAAAAAAGEAAAAAAAAMRDARAALAAKTAELDRLSAERAANMTELEDLRRRVLTAEGNLAAEKAASKEMHDYLVKLSTAITNGDKIPVAPLGIPSLPELVRNITTMQEKASSNQCFLAYYVKFFMKLIFGQPGGRDAYNAVKGDLTALKGTSSNYETLTYITRSFNDPSIRLDTFVPNTAVTRIMGAVFGPDAVDPRDTAVPTRRERNQYDMIMLFIVASQLYLVEIQGSIKGCRVPDEVLNPVLGGPLPPPAYSPPAYTPPAYTSPAYTSPAAPEPIYPSRAQSPSPASPSPASPSPASARAFNVEDEDKPLYTPPSPIRAPTPSPSTLYPPSPTPRGTGYAPDAHTKEQADLALRSIQGIIKTASGGGGRAPKPLSPQEKSTYRSDSKILIDYCSYGDAKHPLSRYPSPDSGVCQAYSKAKSGIKESAFTNGLPRL